MLTLDTAVPYENLTCYQNNLVFQNEIKNIKTLNR